jgi:ABC-type spermidine/putrescine transport system permease subunit II
MFKEITVQRLSAGTLFKLAGVGLAITLISFSSVMGIFAFFGASTVTWNHQQLTGWSGLIASPFIGAFVAVLFTGILGCCMAFGLWLYSKFRPLKLLAKVGGSTDGA